MAVDGAPYGKIHYFNNVDPNLNLRAALVMLTQTSAYQCLAGVRIGLPDRYAIAFAENGTPIEVDDSVYSFDLALKGQYELELEEICR